MNEMIIIDEFREVPSEVRKALDIISRVQQSNPDPSDLNQAPYAASRLREYHRKKYNAKPI